MPKLSYASIMLFFSLSTPIAAGEVIQGRAIEDHSGTAVVGAAVRVSRIDGTAVASKELQTERDGRFLIRNVSPGEYRLTITKPNYSSIEARVTSFADAGEQMDAPVYRLIRFGAISGRVTPAQGGRVIAIEKVASGISGRRFPATVDGSGDYRIFGIPPGRYLLAVLEASTQAGLRRGFMVYPNALQPWEFAIAGGEEYEGANIQLPIEPTFAVSGKVEPNINLPYLASLVVQDRPGILLATRTTQPDGTFRFENIVPGNYELLVSSLATATAAANFGRIHVNVGTQDAKVTVSVEPPRSMELVVTEERSSPGFCSPEGTLSIAPLENWPASTKKSMTVITGKPVSLEGLAPGPYQISMRSAQGGCVGAPIESVDLTDGTDSKSLKMPLHAASSIRVRVQSSNRTEPLSIIFIGLDTHSDSPVRMTVTAQSEFLFSDIPAGRYCVLAQAASESTKHWSIQAGCDATLVNVQGGGSQSVDLRMTEN